MAFSLDFGQVWPSFAGCYFANTVSAPFSMIDGDDPGCPSPRPLRGFRRRWTDFGSVAAASHVGSSEQDFDANANLPELPSPGMDLFGVPGGSDSVDGWALVHEGLAREGSDLYEPESPVNDAAVFSTWT